MDDQKNNLVNKQLKAINCSGFPFQIAITNFVKTVKKKSLRNWWGILCEEHLWHDKESGQKGFIDIVLSNKNRTKTLVIECKRYLDTEWIFLNHLPGEDSRAAAATISINHLNEHFQWGKQIHEPNSPKCMFGIINTPRNKKQAHSIDHIASQVVEATEAFAIEEITSLKGSSSSLKKRQYCSVIVTTAKLLLCQFDPTAISLQTGELSSDVKISSVPFVRYEKQLSTKKNKVNANDNDSYFRNIQEQNVFIVNVDGFEGFLDGMAQE